VSIERRQISAVIATRNRAASLHRTLISLGAQDIQPSEVIVIDASDGAETRNLCSNGVEGIVSDIRWIQAGKTGAGIQRNEAVSLASHRLIWFLDDDILLRSNCVRLLQSALDSDPTLAGVNAMIENQHYVDPGTISRLMFALMNGENRRSFAGKMIGPAINLLPEDRQDLPEVVRVEWLNTTCTLYRREALPNPPFDPIFKGYSLMEDVALSLNVAKRGWKLANARTARIFHDSQPGEHKEDVIAISAMELVNRHYVMTNVLGRRSLTDHLKLGIYELFQIAATLCQNPGIVVRLIRGKLVGFRQILRTKHCARG
jgi:GT2 family glycosyltransferase